jgi:hypothetical protein
MTRTGKAKNNNILHCVHICYNILFVSIHWELNMNFWQSNPYQVRETDLIKLARLAETAALYAYETTEAGMPHYMVFGPRSSSLPMGGSCSGISTSTYKPEEVYASPDYLKHLNSEKATQNQNNFIESFIKIYKHVYKLETTEQVDVAIQEKASKFYRDILQSNLGKPAIGKQFRCALKKDMFTNASIKHDHYVQYAYNLSNIALALFIATVLLSMLTLIGALFFAAPQSLAMLPVFSGEIIALLTSVATLIMSNITAGILECLGHETGNSFLPPFTKKLPKDTRALAPSSAPEMECNADGSNPLELSSL